MPISIGLCYHYVPVVGQDLEVRLRNMVSTSYGLAIDLFCGRDRMGCMARGDGTAVHSLVLAILGVARWLNPNKLRGLNSLVHLV